MKLLSALVDIFLFLALSYSLYMLQWQGAGPGWAQPMIIFVYSLSAWSLLLMGIIKYRFWKNRLYWVLLLVISATFFVKVLPEFIPNPISLDPLLFTPTLAMLVWQIIMTVSKVARILKGWRDARVSLGA